MKRNLLKNLFLVLLAATALFTVSCGKKNKTTSPTTGNPSEPVSSKNKLKVSYSIWEPDVSYSENGYIDSLLIRFSGSVAPIDNVEKKVESGITLTPAISGTWTWTSDTSLSFQPVENWQLNTKYKITFADSIFTDHVSVKGDESFKTGGFTARLTDANFYIDPQDPTNKRVTCTLNASHPIDKTTINNFISLNLELKGEKGSTTSTKNYNYTISYNKSGTTAYIVSEQIPIPPFSSTMNIKLSKGLKTTLNAITDSTDSETVTIPGMKDFVSIRDVDFSLVKNDEQNYDQIISIFSKGDLNINELANYIEVYELPKDRPAEQGWQEEKNCYWSSTYVTDNVRKLSKRLDLTEIPNAENASSVNNFRIKATPGRWIYIKIRENLNFYGGYKLASDYKEVLHVDYYPRELGILSDGIILPLSGSKKIAMYSRGVSKAYYTLSRIMPKDINHLISMSNGNMKNFDWSTYSFTEENISEKETFSQDIYDHSDEYISYFSFDFSNRLKPDAAKHLANGLFLFEVSETSYSGGMHDKRFILVTDLGFIIKTNSDSTKEIFVQSISTGRPVSNAEINVIGLNGNSVCRAFTDSTGHASIPNINTTNEHRPVAYTVKTANDFSFMPYTERGRFLDYSNFDIGGEYTSTDRTKVSAYMFSDRGMYRPGDRINLGVIAKAGDWNINLKNTVMECEVIDPNGSIMYNKQFQLSSSGFEEINFSTQEYSPTGNYDVHLYLIHEYSDGSRSRSYLNSESVKVEEFLPDTLKLSCGFDPLPNDGWINPGTLKGTVSLKNLFGTPAIGNDIKAQINLEPGFPVLRKYSDYYFSDPYYKGNSYQEFLGTTQTDDKGEASFDLDLQKFEKATYRLEFYVEGYEKGSGRSVSQQSSVYVSPLKYLIGYKADGKLSYINKNSTRKISFIAINQDLKKIDLDDVTLQLEEIKYISTLVKQPNGLYKYQSVKKSYPVSTDKIKISKDGTDFFVPSEKAGEYKITLINKDGLTFNTINYTIVSNENTTRSLTRTAELELSLENSDLKAGGQAKIFIKAPYKGAGLITVERDKVYTWKWFTCDDLSTVQTITIPSNLEGNGYINVMYTRATSSDEIFMSPFCYGAIPFSVDKESRQNKITIDVPDEVKSGEDLVINYSAEHPGKAVIYAVDEGILQVANYKMPNPISFFFRKRALQVRTSQILDLILPEYNILKSLSGAMGGGAGMDELSRNLNPFKRKQNAPVAYWSGIVDIGPETRTLTYHVPDYFNGNLKIMAVSVSDATIGTKQTSTLARNTFIISPNAPLAVAPGDEFDVSVTVTNNHRGSGDNAKVTLKITPTDNLKVVGDSKLTLTIPEGKDATTSIKVQALKKLGNAELLFTASDSSESSKLASTMSVRPSMPYQIWLHSGVDVKGKIDIDVNHKLYDEYATREASASIIPTSFTDGLNFYLANYPYGCSEQVTSKAYPYVYDEFVEACGKTRKDSEKMIQETISILQSRQKSSGAIGYWTNESENDDFITLYVADFLTDAKLHNFYVPETFFKKVIDRVKYVADSDLSTAYGRYLASYAVYILTKNEVVTTSYLESIENALIKYSVTETDYEGLYLAASYAMLKQDKKANTILMKIKYARTFDSSWYYHNDLHYVATYIDVIARYCPSRLKDIKTQQIEKLCSFMGYSYYNTMSTAAAIRALESYTSAAAEAQQFEIDEVAGKNATPLTLEGDFILKSDFSPAAEIIRIRNPRSSSIPMYYSVVQAGFETEIPTKQIKDQIEVTREYCSLDGGKLNSIKLGDDVLVKITFRSLKGYQRNIAMVDLQPAGLEADIDSIRHNDGKWKPDYVDIREDRVVIYGSFSDKATTFTYKAKAINTGKFVVPPMFAESMYNKEIRAITPQSPITIEENKSKK